MRAAFKQLLTPLFHQKAETMTSLERDTLILAEYSRLFGDSETCHNTQMEEENAETAKTLLNGDTTQNTGLGVSQPVSALDRQRAEIDRYSDLFSDYCGF